MTCCLQLSKSCINADVYLNVITFMRPWWLACIHEGASPNCPYNPVWSHTCRLGIYDSTALRHTVKADSHT